MYDCIIAEDYGLANLAHDFDTTGALWIGANDEEVEDHFVWLPSGTPLIFVNWDEATGEPNNRENEQHCAVYFHGRKKWHDYWCDRYLYKFVCEG